MKIKIFKAGSVLSFLIVSLAVQASCISGNCINGVGTFVYEDNSKYAGFFVAGKPHGNGVLIGWDGSKYSGPFVKGKKQGLGKWISANGDVYTGNFANDTFEGKGRIAYANGDTYLGDWKSGYASGTGTYTFSDGHKYTGSFQMGDFSGFGRLTEVNGNYYEGAWLKNNKHGQGISYVEGQLKEVEYHNNLLVSERKKEEVLIAASNKSTVDKNLKAANNNKIYSTKITDTKSENQAQSKKELPQIYALIIGVASYQHLPSLKYTDDDAYLMYAFLKSPEGGALADDQIKILVDEAATGKAILNGLQEMGQKAGQDDVFLVFMAGHGFENAFVPGDYNGYNNQLEYKAILAALDQSQARHKLLIADACHSGTMAQARGRFDTSLERYYSAIDRTQGGTAVLMSSAPREVSMEYNGLRQGIFSHYIIRGLKGAADRNNDNLVTVSELYNYVHVGVREYTSKVQNPLIIGDYDKNMPVAWVNRTF